MKLEFPDVKPQHGEERKSLIEQVYYLGKGVDDARFEDGCLTFEFRGSEQEIPALKERVSRLAADNARAFRRADLPVLFEVKGAVPRPGDPHGELFETGQIVEARSPGVFVFRGALLKAMRALDRVIHGLARDVSAEELEVPTTVPLESVVKAGYVASFPQHVLFVAPLHADMDVIQSVEKAARTEPQPAATIADYVTDPSQILSPTVCYHCFEALRGSTVDKQGSAFTALGKCHRHEHKTTKGLERLQTFTMRELMFFGSQEQVAGNIKTVLDATKALLEAWGVHSRVVAASDPFFAIEASKKRTFQLLYGLKQELQVWLPKSEKWLAAGSFNHHRSTLVEPFAIKGEKGPVESGCIGFGYERLLCGIMSQFGVDQSQWPPGLRSSLVVES